MVLFWFNRILAVGIAAVHVLQWSHGEGAAVVFLYGWFLLIPLGLIWFGGLLGEGQGYDVFRGMGIHPALDLLFPRRLHVDASTPGILIKILGWIILLAPWWLAFLMKPRLLN